MQQTITQAITLANSNNLQSRLDLVIDDKVQTVGGQVAAQRVQQPPILQLTDVAVTSHGLGPFIVLAVDLDAPYPSLPLLSPIVHWIQAQSQVHQRGTNTLACKEQNTIVNWLAPRPPPLSGAHRYLIMVFKQPKGFDAEEASGKFVKPVAIPPRLRWGIDAFVKEWQLGDVVAANWFCCRG